jgi:release factor glutamine methyltransferase
MTTIQDHMLAARAHMPDPDTATLDVHLLMAHVLGKDRAYVLAHASDPLDAAQAQAFAALVARRAAGEPYAYIVGWQAFYDLRLRVTPDVLIPRPETELLVEEALAWARQRASLVAADIGTGSGAIAITVKRHAPHARLLATDISLAALEVARFNAASHAVSVEWLHGSLAQPLAEAGQQVDLLMANLPYIPSAQAAALPVSRHEPRQALDGGSDGLALVRELLAQARQICRPGALILLEIGAGQGTAALEAARPLMPTEARVLHDYAGHERIARLVLP